MVTETFPGTVFSLFLVCGNCQIYGLMVVVIDDYDAIIIVDSLLAATILVATVKPLLNIERHYDD